MFKDSSNESHSDINKCAILILDMGMCKDFENLHNSVNQYFPNDQCNKNCASKKLFKVQIDKWILTQQIIKSSLMWFQIPHGNQPLSSCHFSNFSIESKQNVHNYLKRLFKYSTLFYWYAWRGQVFLMYFNQRNTLQQIECRSIYVNSAVFY